MLHPLRPRLTATRLSPSPSHSFPLAQVVPSVSSCSSSSSSSSFSSSSPTRPLSHGRFFHVSRRRLSDRELPQVIESASPLSADVFRSSASLSTMTATLRSNSIIVSDVLRSFSHDGVVLTIPATSTLLQAMYKMMELRVGCLVAMDHQGKHVAGLVTERDIITHIAKAYQTHGNTQTWENVRTVQQCMTQARQMVCVKPTDTIDECLAVMTSQGFRHLPVLDGSQLRGVVSMRNLVDMLYAGQTGPGSKAQFLMNILPRLGVPKDTSVSSQSISRPKQYYLKATTIQVPHPDKSKVGGEDAFVMHMGQMYLETNTAGHSHHPETQAENAPHSLSCNSQTTPFSLIGVFDGVGSWSFEQGLDASKFARTLALASQQFVETHPYFTKTGNATEKLSLSSTNSHSSNSVSGVSQSTNTTTPQSPFPPLTPSSILSHAWHSVITSEVLGSSTACLLTLDGSHELRAVNLGDSGFVILRPSKMGSIGTVHGTNYQVVYRSPQQLHYFNCPLQLGYMKGKIIAGGGETDISKFEQPADADLLSVPVQEGDIIVLATDGLFDNVPEDQMLFALDKELGSSSQSYKSPYRPPPFPPQGMKLWEAHGEVGSTNQSNKADVLTRAAKSLTELAWAASWDKTMDSPFAILAKDNNIMWGGGRKDDITVIVARVEVTQG